ncbi:hypothetical protein GIB67_017435, partial [Kingdonia uniflora]
MIMFHGLSSTFPARLRGFIMWVIYALLDLLKPKPPAFYNTYRCITICDDDYAFRRICIIEEKEEDTIHTDT